MMYVLKALWRAWCIDFKDGVSRDRPPIIRYRVENEYDQSFAALFTSRCQQPTVLTAVTIECFCFSEDLKHFSLSPIAPTGYGISF